MGATIHRYTAFLQRTENRERDLHSSTMETKQQRKLWHLQKCMYGLSDASSQWNNKVKEVLEEVGAKISKLDPAE